MTGEVQIDRNRRATIHARIGAAFFAVAAVALFVSGKFGVFRPQMWVEHNETIYGYGAAARFWQALPALCIGAATWFLAASRVNRLRVLAVLSATMGLVLCFAAYDVATARVVIGSSALVVPARGFPLRPHVTIPYSDLTAVLLHEVQGDGRNASSRSAPDRELQFIRKDGGRQNIPVGDLIEAALRQIGEALNGHGVPFADL
jgi:hypothetical protein